MPANISIRERAADLATDYLKDGVSPDQALSEFAEALDDAEALPSIVRALDAMEAGEEGLSAEDVVTSVQTKLAQKYRV